MKSVFNFKQLLIAVATTVMALNLSSCKDQDFDWGQAHADTAQKKFTNAFIQAYGQPAEDHQWGFDMPWLNDGKSTTRSKETDYSEAYEKKHPVNKADNDNSIPIIWHYGAADDITERESLEVFEWFSTHQVIWENTTEFIGDLSKISSFKDEDGNELLTIGDNGARTISLTEKTILKGTVVDNDGKTYTGEFVYTANVSPENHVFKIVKYVEGNGDTRNAGVTVAYKRGELTTTNDAANHRRRNSLLDYEDFNPLGDALVGVEIRFDHAWVQHVAEDPYNYTLRKSVGDPYYVTNRMTAETVDSEYNVDGGYTPDREFNGTGSEITTSVGMDHLKFTKYHINDFNSGEGWGYGRQSVDGDLNSFYNWSNQEESLKVNSNFPVHYIRKNGVLICGEDFNQASVGVSLSSSERHDKWILVHLKGDGYEGYYLGFDLEAGGTNASEMVKANGYCNDWIIKISEALPKTEQRELPTDFFGRIMCEDLGGKDNKVVFEDQSIMVSDIDYNDVVIDVNKTLDGNNKSQVYITLKAAGGTLPLTVWWEDTAGSTSCCLFETHEMFQKEAMYEDSNHSDDVDYKVMYNTNATEEGLSGGTGSPAPILLQFGASSTELLADKVNGMRVYNIAYDFPNTMNDVQIRERILNSIALKVYRFTTEDYMSENDKGPLQLSDANWVTLKNINGQAPLKMCVPQSVGWLKERHAVHLAYPNFSNWVANRTYFWLTSNGTAITPSTTSHLVSGSNTPSSPKLNNSSSNGTSTPAKVYNVSTLWTGSSTISAWDDGDNKVNIQSGTLGSVAVGCKIKVYISVPSGSTTSVILIQDFTNWKSLFPSNNAESITDTDTYMEINVTSDNIDRIKSGIQICGVNFTVTKVDLLIPQS